MSRIAGFILLLIGLFFGAFATWMVLDVKKYSDNGIATTGSVVEVVASGRRYTPLVGFTTQDGRDVAFYHNVSSTPPEYAVGEKVDVLYIRKNPQDAIISNGMWVFPGIFVGISGLLVTIAAVCFVIDFKNRGKAHEPNTFKDFHKKASNDFDEEWSFDTKVEVREFLRKNQKIEAIKYYKDMTHVSLKEATDAVGEIEKEMKAEEIK